MAEPQAVYELLLGRLGELWLKGRNRHEFTKRLGRNLQVGLDAVLEGTRVRMTHGRVFVDLAGPEQVERALAVCADTPGLTSVSPARKVEVDLEAMKEVGVELATAEWGEGTFAVDARRTWKGFPLTSPEINREVGAAVGVATQLKVDLRHPDHRLGIDVGEKAAYVWARGRRAVGGLPVGCSGRVMLLLSGGIDSPVAGYLAQKRGCELDAVYFHSPPFISEASRDKVETLARRLSTRQGGLRLHVVRFTEIQKAIHAECDGRLAVLLYRRFMYRIAADLAQQRGAQALCTGESLGQVASQTLENLQVVDRLTSLLTLRPLACFDKQEIMVVARDIGTYETSILPYDDCCTLFVPRNPVIRARIRDLEAAEAALEVDSLVAGALEQTEVVTWPSDS